MRIDHRTISHSQLAQCQSNTSEWVSNQVESTFRRTSYKHCLREGICRFHRDRDVKAARQYIQERMGKHGLKNKIRIQESLVCFDAYAKWLQSERITIVGSRVLLNLSLSQGLSLGGIIPRVDMIPQGYRVILLDEIPLRWEEELRMPLIQRGLARTYGRPEDDFVVGIQELDASDLAVVSYSKTEIDHAEQIAQQLAEKVINEFAKYS